MTTPLAATVIGHLQSATLQQRGTQLHLSLPPLDRAVFTGVKAALTRLGADWKRRENAFVFQDPAPEARQDLQAALDGLPPRDRNPLDYYPTPDKLSAELAAETLRHLSWLETQDPQRTETWRVLEPHAGHGALLTALNTALRSAHLRCAVTVHAGEADPARHAALRSAGHTLVAADALAYHPDTPYHVVLMNPPFSAPGDPLAWQTHATHALTLLAEDGLLLTVVPDSASSRHGPLFTAARGLDVDYAPHPTPVFRHAGTDVRTGTLRMLNEDVTWKDAPFGTQDGLYPSWYAFETYAHLVYNSAREPRLNTAAAALRRDADHADLPARLQRHLTALQRSEHLDPLSASDLDFVTRAFQDTYGTEPRGAPPEPGRTSQGQTRTAPVTQPALF